MKKLYIALSITLLIFIALSGCTQQAGITINGDSNDWQNIPEFIQDAVGDTQNIIVGNDSNSREIYEFDVTSIKCATDSTNLYVFIEFAHDMNYYFNNNRDYSRNIGTLYFDTDNNTITGTNAFASNTSGFESKININSGVWNIQTGVAGSGGFNLSQITEATKLRYFVEYLSYPYNESNQRFSANTSQTAKSFETPQQIAYGSNFIEFSIPLDKVGLQDATNRTIRILFAERGSGLGEQSFSGSTDALYHI